MADTVKKPLVFVLYTCLLRLLLPLSGQTNSAYMNIVIYIFIYSFLFFACLFTYRRLGYTGSPVPICPKKRHITDIVCLLPLTFGAVLLFSLLSAAVAAGAGRSVAPTVSPSPFALFRHALLPALLEEAFFRYLPLRFLTGTVTERRAAWILSSVLFAAFHFDLLRLPYALAAGLLYFVFDGVLGSLFPSVLWHVLTNALSLLSPLWTETTVGRAVFLFVSGTLCLLSLGYAALGARKCKYKWSIQGDISDEYTE